MMRPRRVRLVSVALFAIVGLAIGIALGGQSDTGAATPASTSHPPNQQAGTIHYHDESGGTHVMPAQDHSPSLAVIAGVVALIQGGGGVVIVWAVRQLAKNEAIALDADLVRRNEQAIHELRLALTQHDMNRDAHPELVRSWEQRRDTQLREGLDKLSLELKTSLSEIFRDLISEHNHDPRAHGEAVDRNHMPILQAIRELTQGMREASTIANDSLKASTKAAELVSLLVKAHNEAAVSGTCPLVQPPGETPLPINTGTIRRRATDSADDTGFKRRGQAG